MPKNEARVGGLTAIVIDPGGIDPAVAQFQQSAARNRAAMTRRQRYDAARKRVRTDCPQWLIDQLDAIAAQLNTSRNQLGAFLLAYAVHRYQEDDPELDDLLNASMAVSRSINVDCDLDLAALYSLVANPAEGSKCAE